MSETTYSPECVHCRESLRDHWGIKCLYQPMEFEGLAYMWTSHFLDDPIGVQTVCLINCYGCRFRYEVPLQGRWYTGGARSDPRATTQVPSRCPQCTTLNIVLTWKP